MSTTDDPRVPEQVPEPTPVVPIEPIEPDEPDEVEPDDDEVEPDDDDDRGRRRGNR